jgi:arylsulfatase A
MVSAFCSSAISQTVKSDSPPNIILILADDLGFHELGAFGQEKIKTPHIDSLARDGMKLTRYYSGSPVCAPSRAVLLTGLHTGHAPIRGNKEMGTWDPETPEGQYPLPDQITLLPELLKQQGYTTGVFGKWGLGGPGSEGHPSNQGVDHFYGYLCQRVAHNYYPTHLWRNHDVDVLDGNTFFAAHQRITEPPNTEAGWDQFKGQTYAPEEIINELLGWTEAQISDDKPFFLCYWSLIPHVALQVPEEFVDMYPQDWDTEPYLGDKGYLPHPRPNAAYAGMISYFDNNVGRILDLLEAKGVADNTLIIFTSDNGTTWVGGVDREFFGSLGDLRGRKGTLWEGGIKMPTIARWPGQIPPGSNSDFVCAAEDLYPTFSQVAGIQPPHGLDGQSILPILTGKGNQPSIRTLYWEYPEGKQQQAVLFEGRYKAIRPNLNKENLPEHLGLELYDLILDPNETTDIAIDRPNLVAKAIELMQQHHLPNEVFPINAID